jgi:hypothetical protein
MRTGNGMSNSAANDSKGDNVPLVKSIECTPRRRSVDSAVFVFEYRVSDRMQMAYRIRRQTILKATMCRLLKALNARLSVEALTALL